jgi:hypothetical protein
MANKEYEVVVAIMDDAGVLRKRIVDHGVEESLQELVGKKIDLSKHSLGLTNGKVVLTKRGKSVQRGLLREVVVNIYPAAAPKSKTRRIRLGKIIEVAVANSLLKSKSDGFTVARKPRREPTSFQRQAIRRVKRAAGIPQGR